MVPLVEVYMVKSRPRGLRSQCLALAALSVALFSGEQAKADYTRINSVSRVSLADVSTNCDFRFRILAGKNANNTYRVTYVSQNASVGYILEAVLSSTQGNELVAAGGNLFMSPPRIGGTPAPGAPTLLRVTVPFAGGAGSAGLALNGQSFNLNGSLIDVEKQCASTTNITPEGGGDGCAMLAGKAPDGKCYCRFDALSNNNPCRNLSTRQCFSLGNSAKCVGPVDSSIAQFYTFNANNCACELCDPEVRVNSADRASCSCKFSSLQELMANPPGSKVNPWGALQALRDSCMRVVSAGGPGGYFNKSTCSCEPCPTGKRPNDTYSGCI